MRNKEHDPVRSRFEEGSGEASRDTPEAAPGIEKGSSGIEADRERHPEIVGQHRVVHVTATAERGGLLRLVEALAVGQSARHRVLVISPVPVDTDSRYARRALAVRGNSFAGDHRRLLAVLRQWRATDVFLHCGSPGELAVAAVLCSRRRRVIVVEHAPQLYPMSAPARDRVFAWCKRQASVWVSVSLAGARHLESSWHLESGSIATVYSGVAAPGECIAAEAPESFPREVVAFGRPTVEKGFDQFCSIAGALARDFPEIGWRWYGGDRAASVGAVTVVPWVEDIGPVLRNAVVVVIPSRSEGVPLLLLEAWACGCAVVARAVGGIPEIAENGRDAVLLADDSERVWADTVARLLQDPVLRGSLGAAGRATWEGAFTAEAMVARYERLLGSPSDGLA